MDNRGWDGWMASLTQWTWVWVRLWCWEGLGSGREGDDRGWDGWMASLTRWMWVWVNSGSWWWTGILWFMGLKRVRHDWATELKNSDSIQNHILLFTAQASQRRYLWWVGERFFAGLFYYLLIDDISWPLTQGHGDHLQYYCLENPMDRGAWWATVQEVAKSQTQLKRLTWHMHARPF